MAARLASRFHVAWAIAARTTNNRDEYDMGGTASYDVFVT